MKSQVSSFCDATLLLVKLQAKFEIDQMVIGAALQGIIGSGGGVRGLCSTLVRSHGLRPLALSWRSC